MSSSITTTTTIVTGGSSSSKRAPGTINGTELFDVENSLGAISRGHALCSFMRLVFASCSTVIPPAIAGHLELDSPFLFYFFCRLAEIPNFTEIDALGIACGDVDAIDTAMSIIGRFIEFDRLADVNFALIHKSKRPKRQDVFRFQEVRRSSSVSPNRRKLSVVSTTSSSVPNAFPQSVRRSISKNIKSPRKKNDKSYQRSQSAGAGRRGPAWVMPGVLLQASITEKSMVGNLGIQGSPKTVFQGTFQVEMAEQFPLSWGSIFAGVRQKLKAKLPKLPQFQKPILTDEDQDVSCSIMAWDEHILDAVKGQSLDPLRRLVKSEPMPASRRPLIWWLLAGVGAPKSQSSDAPHRPGTPRMFRCYADDEYAKLAAAAMKDPPEVAEVILADVPRTMESSGFDRIGSSQEVLTRLLFAYARRNPRLGYCQGMHLMAATLLAVTDERSAFYILVHIVEDIMPSDYYSNLDGTLTDRDVMLDLAKRFHPRLVNHLDNFGINDVSIFTLPWIMSIFSNLLPPYSPAASVVVDAVLVGGSSVLFRLALSVLGMCEGALLRMTDCNEVKGIFQRFALGIPLPRPPDDSNSSDCNDSNDDQAAPVAETDFELAEKIRNGCWRYEVVTPKLLATARDSLRRVRVSEMSEKKRHSRKVKHVQGEYIAIVHEPNVEIVEYYFV